MERQLSPTRRWARAIREAAGAPEPREAVHELLREAITATGAGAGALLIGAEFEPAWRVDVSEGALEALLAPGTEAHTRLEEIAGWLDGVALLQVGAADGTGGRDAGDDDGGGLDDADGPARHLMLVPLRVRELCTGALLLTFAGGPPPPEAAQEAAAAFASFIALLLENGRLQDESRQALQSREHFLTALNHELRTPANVLLLNADLLSSGTFGELPPRMAQALQEAEANVRMMVAVLRRVLDLGQLGDQAAPERSEVLHPREAIAGLLRRMEPAAKRKNLSLSLYVPRNLAPIQTDPDRFERIIIQLVSNAVKYTSAGGIDVRIERGRRSVGPHRHEPVLIVRVSDTGRGIPQEEIERVFEPFAQVEEGARSDTGRRGVGLGLPLARQLARSLRGEITIESVPGHGTTASLILPYITP
jgi:signal transduction histidine kinase